MIDSVDGTILWDFPVNGHQGILDEILTYWYPSHAKFLDIINSPNRIETSKLEKIH
jgi:hypothetical protein